MKCDICNQREATVFLTQMLNNEIRKLHLCEKCAIASGLDLDNAVSVTDALLGTSEKKQHKQPATRPTEKKCPSCKMSLADFKKISRFGCAMCYETFADEIKNMVEEMHRNTRHIGKKPVSHPASTTTYIEHKDSLEELKFRLQKAIELEDYEKAAGLRDKIQQISTQYKKLNDLPEKGEKQVK
jgi:protein arginine kinase activator